MSVESRVEFQHVPPQRAPSTAILIAGPTASGKSALALEHARRLGGAVLNADSMQVYADLRVLTARPSAQDEAQAPHRLYGHVDAGEPYSVARWAADAARELHALNQERPGATAIFVGGTGLYFEALTTGLSPIPAIPEAVRAHWRSRGLAEPAQDLHRLLAERDPATAARLLPSDPQRIVRALEVLEATGRPLSSWQEEPPLPGPLAGYAMRRIVLAPPRPVLYGRIDARFAAMLEGGAVEEVRALLARGLDPALPCMKALGVAPIAAMLRGELTEAQAMAQGAQDTRRYAKRQLTWFRNRMADWEWIAP